MKIKFYPLTDTKPEVVNNFYADSEVEVYEILAEDDDEIIDDLSEPFEYEKKWTEKIISGYECDLIFSKI